MTCSNLSFSFASLVVIRPLCSNIPEHAALFAQLIARTAKDIDVLIDSLPSEESSPELQVSVMVLNYDKYIQ